MHKSTLPLLAACAVSALSLLLLSGCTKQTAAEEAPSEKVFIEVEVAPVTRANLVGDVALVGDLIPYRRAIVAAEVAGTIVEIPISKRQRLDTTVAGEHISQALRLDMGVAVAKGDLLVRLDASEHQLNYNAAKARVDMANAELKKLKAWRRTEEVSRAKATRDQAQAGVVLAMADLERAETLLRRDALSTAEYDQAKAQADSAKAVLTQANAELELSQAGPTPEDVAVADAAVRQAMAELERADWALKRTEIYAPYDAMISERYVDVGDRVTAAPPVDLMELLDLSILIAQIGVPERYIGKIHVGDQVQVFVAGEIDPLPGVIALINDKVDVTSRTFRARVALRNTDGRLKAAQFVRVVFPVRRAAMSLTVPAEAVTYAGGEAQVFVFDDGVVRQQPVVLGITSQEAAEILSGASEGQMVVVDDPSILSDGMTVRLPAAEKPKL